MRYVPLFLLLLAGCQPPSAKVVLYSAQDREFAEPLFAEFEQHSKLSLQPKFDTEANKSVSLASDLVTEQPRPRADVHWGNEPLAAIRLARQGVYEAYASPAAADFPAWTKQPAWQAFASRARVLIVNTSLVPEDKRPKSLLDLTKPEWKGKVAMAKPMFGTTATQAACLFEVLGPAKAKEFFSALKANDVAIVAGNKNAAVDVAAGKYAVGLTDTDDAIIELNAGKPVAIVFPDRDPNVDHPRLGVLYLPNTLALVKGGPNPAGGKKLIDYLVAKEAALAEGGGFQIPLNPALAETKLPAALLPPAKAKRMEVDFEKAADLWETTQAVIRELFAR